MHCNILTDFLLSKILQESKQKHLSIPLRLQFATVLQIPMPCELEEAKKVTEKHFDQFISSIINSLDMV